MNNLIKSLFTAAVLCFATFAKAGQGFLVFDTIEQCQNAATAQKAVAYTPKTDAPFKGGKGWTKKQVGAGGKCLLDAYVLEDGLPTKGKVVFVAAGFEYWEHTSGAFRMHKCSNPFGGMHESVTQTASAPVATPTGSCTDCADSVRTVTQLTRVIERAEVIQQCFVNGRETPLQNGKCVAPEMTVQQQVRVDTQVSSSQTCGANQNQTGSCQPKAELKVENATPRTDDRCVYKLATPDNQVRFVVLGRDKANRLVAYRVNDERAVIDRNLPVTYVGDANANTVVTTSTDCKQAADAFQHPNHFLPTVSRLQMPNCKVIGRV